MTETQGKAEPAAIKVLAGTGRHLLRPLVQAVAEMVREAETTETPGAARGGSRSSRTPARSWMRAAGGSARPA